MEDHKIISGCQKLRKIFIGIRNKAVEPEGEICQRKLASHLSYNCRSAAYLSKCLSVSTGITTIKFERSYNIQLTALLSYR